MMQPKDQMHPEDRRNMIIFVILAIAVYMAYDHYVLKPKMHAMRAAQEMAQERAKNPPPADIELPRVEILAEGPRLKIDNPMVFGTIGLTGGRIDDLSLHDYYETPEHRENVVLLSPAGTPYPRYAEFGWIADGEGPKVPGPETVWKVRGGAKDAALGPGSPVTLEWNNGQGLRFERTYAIDDRFLITVKDKVVNESDRPVTLYPYGLIAQKGLPEHYAGRSIVHEGPIGYIGDELHEPAYNVKAEKLPPERKASTGWIGITDKYWLAAILPDQQDEKTFRFTYKPAPYPEGKELYQTDVLGAPVTVPAKGASEHQMSLFAGAKLVRMLGDYEESLGVRHFDLAVDFGMYYFMTKPFFFLLDFLFGMTGNFGIAIILFTVMLRILVFPLANMSFKSFAGLKKLGPRMKELRDEYGDDKQKLQEELIKLYQKEKVNPMAGCLPILIQIPIFFSLYKVLSMTIEMRHAPFFGWIHDLSSRDPTSVFNLFGLIPWTPPDFLMIGVWPCLMLGTMILQKSMNPPPQDPMQAKMIAFMPWMMTFILSKFASGLVIYWTFNNIFSMIQQYIIMTRMGAEVRFFGRTRAERKLEEKVLEGPDVHPEAAMIEHKIEDVLFGRDGEKEEQAQAEVSPPKPKKKKKKS